MKPPPRRSPHADHRAEAPQGVAWLHGESPVAEAAGLGLVLELCLDPERHKTLGPAGKALVARPPAPLRRKRGGQTVEGRPRALAALVRLPAPGDEKTFFSATDFKTPFLALFPVGVQDPQNLGALCRSVAAFGHRHLWLPEKGSAPLGETALNVSRGGLLSLCVTRLGDPPGAVSRFKDQGGVVLAADMQGEPLRPQPLAAPTLLLLGAEGEGLPPRLRAQASRVISIPLPGPVGSLNVASAGAVMLWALGQGGLGAC